MDVTDTTPRRFQVAIELFLGGQEGLSYYGVYIQKERNCRLSISSGTEWEIERTKKFAKERIERAKLALEDLCQKSEEIRAIANEMPHDHYFCYDYYTGGILLAKEIDGTFTWLGD